MPTNIESDAKQELENLAVWVSQTAEMKEAEGKKNLLECVDKDREAKAGPLLEQLGYAKIRVKDHFTFEDSMWHFANWIRVISPCYCEYVERLRLRNPRMIVEPCYSSLYPETCRLTAKSSNQGPALSSRRLWTLTHTLIV